MTHRAYANFWMRDAEDSSSDRMLLDRFQRLLESVPLSAEHPGFTRLVVRAVGPAETPVAEFDLRGRVSSAADVIALAGEHVDPDIEFEVWAFWDLWRLDAHTGTWQRGPEPVLILCRGPLYDDGIAAQTGYFEADVGLEQLYTGPSGLLDPGDPGAPLNIAAPQAAEKVAENIRQLFQWLRAVEKALPIDRYQLWSEGEENLEARLDQIIAVR